GHATRLSGEADVVDGGEVTVAPGDVLDGDHRESTMSAVMAEGLKPFTIRYTPKMSSQKTSGTLASAWAVEPASMTPNRTAVPDRTMSEPPTSPRTARPRGTRPVRYIR